MAKKKIEIEEVKEEKTCCGQCENTADCNCETDEKKGKKILLSSLLTLVLGAVTAGAMYFVSKKETPAPVNDVFKAPAQPIIPKATPVVDIPDEVLERAAEVVEEPVVEEVAPVEAPVEEDGPKGPMNFVGNSTTKVFHTLDCGLGARIEDDQKVAIGSVEEAFAYDYKPCGRCKPNGTGDYVCNTESKVFHKAECFLAKDRMLDEKKLFVGSREDAVARGYEPCGRCKP